LSAADVVPAAAPAPRPTDAAILLGRLTARFFADFVDGEGRVVRHDHDGDTVSEGQAYALLLAAAIGDEQGVDRVWGWTASHLTRPDGLLAWHWAAGAVTDAEAASDADLDAARALVLAGDRFGRPDLRVAGVALGAAILDHLTVLTGAGRVLIAGGWADPGTGVYDYNPSYASPAAYAALGRASGDPRWAELATGSAAVTAALLDRAPLPPDWARVHKDGRAEALAGARGWDTVIRYSYDAARLPVRYAESADPADRALAARLAPTLDEIEHLPASLSLDGAALDDVRLPLAFMGRAAALAAAGSSDAAARDVGTALGVAEQHPTYYGAAWAALGVAMLATDALGGAPLIAIDRVLAP
jgi:endoglucanase